MDKAKSAARQTSFALLVGAGIGAVITAPAILAAIISGGAGHGSYVVARAPFPFSMLLTLFEGDTIGPVAIGMGLLQFPLYGALVGRALNLKTGRAVLFVGAAHVLAGFACFLGLLPNFS